MGGLEHRRVWGGREGIIGRVASVDTIRLTYVYNLYEYIQISQSTVGLAHV